MNVTAHQEKEKNKETKTGKRRGGEKRRRENRRPILKKLFAALLRSFREQHSEKMKGSARGNWDPREVQQPFRPNPNGVGDRTTTIRCLLIGAEYTFSYGLSTFCTLFSGFCKLFSVMRVYSIFYPFSR